MSLSLIESITKLSIQPGDAVVLRTKRILTMQQAARLRAEWEPLAARFGAIAILLDADFNIEVLTKDET